MGIPANVARVSLQGTLPGGEIFSTGFWVRPSDGGSDVPSTNADAQTMANNIVGQTAFGTLITGLKSLLSTSSAYATLRVDCYPTGGPRATASATAAIASGTGTGANALPDQVCWVATLRTGQIGRSLRGRMYLPANGYTITTTTGLFIAHTPTIAALVAAYFTSLPLSNTIPGSGVGAEAVVVSSRLTVATHISQVTNDHRPDIQRRRADRQNIGTVSSATV